MAGTHEPKAVRAALEVELERWERAAQRQYQDAQNFAQAAAAQGIGWPNNGLGSPFQGVNQLTQSIAQQKVHPVKAKEGVLMWQGRELPENWRGAEYKMGIRSLNADSKQWKFVFHSEWSSDTIILWLDPDTYSGSEADKIAETYLETINQRRVG
jgi:hypothetical protein